MSRSYKLPHVKSGRSGSKRLASKKARGFSEDIPDGKWYKKIYESYEIVDYRNYCDKPEYRRK